MELPIRNYELFNKARVHYYGAEGLSICRVHTPDNMLQSCMTGVVDGRSLLATRVVGRKLSVLLDVRRSGPELGDVTDPASF